MVPDAAVTIMKSGVIRTVKMDLFTVFPLFIWTSYGKSVDTTEKSALKLVKVLKLKVIRLKRAKI